MPNTLVVVNGRARSGKDTAVGYLDRLCVQRGVQSKAISSIDPVFSMLTGFGIRMDRLRLTEADRALLSEVGASVEKHGLHRTKSVLHQAMLHFKGAEAVNRAGVLWVHMREPENIGRLGKMVLSQGFRFRTLIVHRPNVEQITSNASDANVDGMNYDVTIHNDGSLEDLRERCFVAWNWLGLGDAP